MGRYAIGRLLHVIPVLIIISFLTIAMLRLAPGDPAATLAGDTATPEQIERIRHNMRLDRSIPVQYALFMRDALQGDLGRSVKTNRAVTDELRARMKYTGMLALSAMTFAIVVGFAAGIISAARHNSWLDNSVMIGVVAGYSLPSFWVGLMLMMLFGVRLGWLPFIGAGSWQNLVLPTLTLGIGPAAVIARLTRSGIIKASIWITSALPGPRASPSGSSSPGTRCAMR